jgi:hypothetical protein
MAPIKHHKSHLEQKLFDTFNKEQVFYGFPNGNYLKQVCVIMVMWHQKGRFPVKFLEIPSLMEHDQTEHYIQSLEKLNPFLGDIFKELNSSNKSPRAL